MIPAQIFEALTPRSKEKTMNETPGQRLKAHRRAAGLTQEQFAGQMGISCNYYARVERGNYSPGRQVLAWLQALENGGIPISPALSKPTERRLVALILHKEGQNLRTIAQALGVTMRQISRYIAQEKNTQETTP